MFILEIRAEALKNSTIQPAVPSVELIVQLMWAPQHIWLSAQYGLPCFEFAEEYFPPTERRMTAF